MRKMKEKKNQKKETQFWIDSFGDSILATTMHGIPEYTIF